MIAVTGATGLLGSFIVRQLLEDGHHVVAIKRENSDTKLLHDCEEKIEWRIADVENAVAIEDALKGVSTVIHAAAMVSFNPRQREKLLTVNALGTRHVVNACLHHGIQKLIHISSVAALGRLKGQEFVDESNKWIDNQLNSIYAESKYLAELEVMRGWEEGLETIILNPSVILSAADWDRSSAKLFKYVWDEKPFYINNHLNVVDVRDVVDAVIKSLSETRYGERFILNGGAIPLIDFFSKVAERFNKKPPAIELGRLPLKIIVALESIRSRFTKGEPLITSETARLAGTRFLYSNEKAKAALKLEFRTIDATLDWCCHHYINKLKHKK